eukprot:TRINITY_DN19045_c0_g1_i1.p1 TRINITY_DN19045_c0_g1~~TRINITY_DN19045_c0_g1_i1.p1  ORF type:complete len:570 (+),score=93.72 TRINITY_DN19045_c0_g1_i1:125-1834(+)
MSFASFDPSKGFIQFGEGQKDKAEAHLQSITRYNNSLTPKKRKPSDDEPFKTPPNKAKGKVEDISKVAHPTDVAPSALNGKNVLNKHIGCFLKEATLSDLPVRRLKEGVLTAMHHVSSSFPVALSNVFPNNSTETTRKIFLHCFHYAALAMSKGDLKMKQFDYLDPPQDDAAGGESPAADSPESTASVKALTEDSTDQAGTRASDVCFKTRSTALGDFYPAFLCEEKGDKPLAPCVPQWIGYGAPKVVELLQALKGNMRWLDLPGCVTSTNEWMGVLARPLAWVHLSHEGPRLEALDGEPERFKEAQSYIEAIRIRYARVQEDFPNVTYEGPFLVFEVLYTESRAFLSFPLSELSPNNGTLHYLQFFLSSCFRSRVEEWTPATVYELYGAAWASQHLRSAVLTYAPVEKAREMLGRELTPEALRAILLPHEYQNILIDPLRLFRGSAAPAEVTTASEAMVTEASRTVASLQAGPSNAGPWWEAATVAGFAKGMDRAGWLYAEGDDAASRVRQQASKHVASALMSGDQLDPSPTPENELVLQVLSAAKLLVRKEKTKQAKELLQILAELL